MKRLKMAVVDKNGDLSAAYYAARDLVDANRDGRIDGKESQAFVAAYERANGPGSAADLIAFDAGWGGAVARPVKANLAAVDKNRDGKLDADDRARIKEFLLKEGVIDIDKVLSEVNDAVSDEFQKMKSADVGSAPQLNSGNPQQAQKDSARGK